MVSRSSDAKQEKGRVPKFCLYGMHCNCCRGGMKSQVNGLIRGAVIDGLRREIFDVQIIRQSVSEISLGAGGSERHEGRQKGVGRLVDC